MLKVPGSGQGSYRPGRTVLAPTPGRPPVPPQPQSPLMGPTARRQRRPPRHVSTPCAAHAMAQTARLLPCMPLQPRPPPTWRMSRSQHTQHVQPRRRAAASAAAGAAAAAEPLAPADSSAAAAAPQVLAGKTVAVVGGGPAGMLCAAHLARLGAAVEVFERHDPAAAEEGKPPPALWNIALGDPAKTAIEAAGLSSDFGPKWRAEGVATLPAEKPPKFFGKWAGEAAPMGVTFLAMATQPGIVAHLRAECERVYGAAVAVTQGMRAVGGNVCAGELVLEDLAGEQQERRFDMVVGADGAGSAVRQLMQEQDPKLQVEVHGSSIGIVCANVRSPGHPRTYGTLPTPSGKPFPAVPEQFDGPMDGCALTFLWPSTGGPSTCGRLVIAMRHGGGQVSFALTGSVAWLRAQHAQHEVLAMLEAAYPQLPRAWLEDMAAHVHDRALEEDLRVRSPTFVTCSKIASGRAVLIRDAAHAVSPHLGMGCNSALQDSAILARECCAAAGDIDAAAQQFDAARRRSVHVLAGISRKIEGFMSFKYNRNVLAFITGFPYAIIQIVALLPKSAPVPGIVKPGFSMLEMFQKTEDWTKIQSNVRWYTARLVVVFALVATLISALLWRAVSVLVAMWG